MNTDNIICHRIRLPYPAGEAVLVSVFVREEPTRGLALEHHVFLPASGRHLHAQVRRRLEAEDAAACREHAIQGTRALLARHLRAGTGSRLTAGDDADLGIMTAAETEPPFHAFHLANVFRAELQEIADWTCSARLRVELAGLSAYRSDVAEAWLLARLFGARQDRHGQLIQG